MVHYDCSMIAKVLCLNGFNQDSVHIETKKGRTVSVVERNDELASAQL